MGNAPVTLGIRLDGEYNDGTTPAHTYSHGHYHHDDDDDNDENDNGGNVVDKTKKDDTNLSIGAGERLSGSVLAGVPSGGLKNVDKVVLELIGEEWAKSKRRNGGGGGGGKKRYVHRSIVTVRIVLRTFADAAAGGGGGIGIGKGWNKNKMRAGKYDLPFSVDLPTSLPSSARIYKSSSSWCEIKYVMRAVIVSSKSAKNDIVVQRPVHVRATPLPRRFCPALIEPVTTEIRNAVGMSKGTITFGVRVSNTLVGRGEDLEVRLACRNDSTVDVDRVQAKVKEIVEWGVAGPGGVESGSVAPSTTTSSSVSSSASSAMSSYDTTVEDIFVNPSIVCDAAGLGRKSRAELKKDRKAGVDPQQENYLDIFGEITSSSGDGDVVRLKIPETARDSFKGQIVRVRHLLIIKLKTKWGVDDPRIEIPLMIGSRAEGAEAHDYTAVLPPPLPIPLPPPATGDDSGGEEEAEAEERLSPDVIPVAVPIGWSGAERSLRIIAPPDSVVVGGTVVSGPSKSGGRGEDGQVVAALPPVPLPIPTSKPALEQLQSEMVASVNDYDIVSSKLEDADWRRLFSSLSPDDFGSIIGYVNQDFDEPRVAALIAPVIGDGSFTCSHCAAAIRSCEAWNRVFMTQALLPFCTDLASGRAVIEAELTKWEKVVTASDFDRVVSR